MNNDDRQVRQYPGWRFVALAALLMGVAVLLLALGQGEAERTLAQNQNIPDAEYSVDGDLVVKPLPACTVTGSLGVFLGETLLNQSGLDAQGHDLVGAVAVQCDLSNPPSQLQVTGQGSCKEIEPVTAGTVVPPFNCSSTVFVNGTCNDTGEACTTPGLQFVCNNVTSMSSITCSLALTGKVNSTNTTRDVNSGTVTLTAEGVGGIVTDLAPADAASPLEADGSTGPNAGMLAGIIAGATVAAVALGGAGWYARRRWVH